MRRPAHKGLRKNRFKEHVAPPERYCHCHCRPGHWRPRVVGVFNAQQWDFVQDFLSNVATLWLWVDTYQFDTDARGTFDLCHVFPRDSPACIAMQSQLSSADEGTPHQVPSKFVHAVCLTCCLFCVSGLPKAFRTVVGRHLSDMCYRCQALPSSCRQDHLLATHDVVRSERWDH